MGEPLQLSSALLNSRLVKDGARRPDIEARFAQDANAGRSARQTVPHVRKIAARVDIASSRGRRRMWGGRALLLPPRIAAEFTEAQRAALSVIVSAVAKTGICDFPVPKIAAIAGVCRTVVQDTLRKSRKLGLLKVVTRRNKHNRRYSFPNLVSIKCREFAAHVARFVVKSLSPLDFRVTVLAPVRPSINQIKNKGDSPNCEAERGSGRRAISAWAALKLKTGSANG